MDEEFNLMTTSNIIMISFAILSSLSLGILNENIVQTTSNPPFRFVISCITLILMS